jgi:Rieske 2Fe-2S family protein
MADSGEGLQRSLPRAAYWDDAFFASEQSAVFWSEWFLVARAETLGANGSYRVLDVAGESVIVLRDGAGVLRAHLNFCRHRGSRLLTGDGSLRGAIRCPYHAWAYALDGTLVATPFIQDGDLPDEVRRLHLVELAEWGGFVFVRVAPKNGTAGPSLAEQLGAVAQRVARYPLAELQTGATLRYQVAANWKVVLENYNECYHCAGVHPELCRLVPAFKRRGGAGLDWENGIPHRSGAVTFTASGTTARAPFAGLDAYERTRHKGELVYPNLMLSLACDHVAAFTVFPQAPGRTAIVCDLLFHPLEMERSDFDPSDARDFWDVVNRQDWQICESVQAGMRSHAFRYGYYAPMEDASLDIRRYLEARLSPGA